MLTDTSRTILQALAFLAALLWVGAAIRRSQTKQRRVWSAFATRRGWGFTTSGKRSSVMELQGQHQGHELSLLTEGRGGSEKRCDVTVLRMDLSDTMPRQLSLTPEDRLFKLLGGKDAQVGGAELDAALELQGARVRQHLLEVHRAYEHFTLEEGLLEAVYRGIPKTLEELETVLAPALELVDALDEAARQARERRA
jgi:hypothetical protein